MTFEVRAAFTSRRQNLAFALEDSRGDEDRVSRGRFGYNASRGLLFQ